MIHRHPLLFVYIGFVWDLFLLKIVWYCGSSVICFGLFKFLLLHYSIYPPSIRMGNNVTSAEVLEESLLGVGTVLRLEKDVWSMLT